MIGRPTRRSDASRLASQEATPQSLDAAMASTTDMVGAQHEAL
jgi:hypothetical protein